MGDEIEFMGVLLEVLHYFVRPLVFLAVMVFGFIILFCKTRSTRVLGVSFILSSAMSLLDCAYIFVARSGNMEFVIGFNYFKSILSMVLTIVMPLFVCIYIHKNYGKKLIYLPLLLLPVVQTLCSLLSAYAINNGQLNLSGREQAAWLNLSGTVIGFVFGTIANIIVIVVFYKNRKTEKVIPLTWLIKTILLGWGAIGAFFRCIAYSSWLNSELSYSLGDTATMSVNFMSAIAGLALPVYVMIMALGAGKKSSAA